MPWPISPVLAIAESTAAQMITSITSLFTLIITGVLAYVMAKMKYNQELESQKVAAEVVNVKEALKTTTAGTDAKLLDVKQTLEATKDVTDRNLKDVKQTLEATRDVTDQNLKGVREVLETTRDVTDSNLKDVKSTLVSTNAATGEKLGDLAKIAQTTMETGNKVHILVNSAMATQLRISEIALRRIADLANHPDDIAAADLAKKSYEEHVRNQAHLDVLEATPAPDPLP